MSGSKVEALAGAELAYWVAKACGNHRNTTPEMAGMYTFPAYASDWVHGGPIIDQERIALWADAGKWYALHPTSSPEVYDGHGGYIDVDDYCGWPGSTALEAAMRAYVASKFGSDLDE